MKFHPEKSNFIRISNSRRRIINTSYQLHGHTLEVVDSSKYVGVTISEDLTWRKHVEDTVNKANKTLGFVRRNLSKCKYRVKSVAYTTIVHPRLEYSCIVWDPHLASDIHILEQVHRRAARFVHRIRQSVLQDVSQTWSRALGGSPSSSDATWIGYPCFSKSSMG